MVGAARLGEFTLAALLIELTPGPNMTYLAALSVTRGAKAGFSAVCGVALGLATLGVCATFGLTRLIEASPALYAALRFAGVAFMLWLAWDAWRADNGEAAVGRPALGAFGRGLVSNLLNPKAALFYLAVPPQFVDPARAPASQLLTLVAIYVAIATLVHTGIVAGAATLRSGAVLQGAGAARLRKAMAALLALVALWLLWETRR
ncbi:MAG TPA: LysE family translocator [Roseiarcus sp.]|nr:LysE family translocator [Roseiarcus sp.]